MVLKESSVHDPANSVTPAADAAGEVYAMPATQGEVRFWSLDQLNPGNPALNMPLMWQFTGQLDVPVLVEAFAECVQRHETLRTTFEVIDGKLSQVIQPEMEIPIPVVDLSGLTGEAQRAAADELTRDHAAFRMDLKTGPLLLLKLLKFNDQRHLLLVTMHHIICDGISNGILMRDMVTYYEALLKGTAAKLPELPIQFADYAIWHEEWRAGDEPEASMKFWRKALGNDFKKLELAHDVDACEALPPERRDITGDIETLLIPRDLTARAHAFCKRENVTLNILLFSIFCGLMSRLTGQKDLTIGSPCANRNEDTENLIGLFMNIQVLRVRLEQSSSFRDLLRQVQAWTLGAYENQALPFEDLVHDAFFSQTGSAFEIPIFFLYQKSFMLVTKIESAAGSLEIIPLRSESPGAVFEVMFAIVDRDEEGPRLQLEYNPQEFKASTIQRYLRLFVNLLESALDGPETLVDELDLLSGVERQRLLGGPNATTVDFGAFEPVHACFLRRATAEPERIAAECDGRSWSYGELAEFSTALAKRLIDEGLQPGGLVGVCVSRSLEMLGSVLAVLMAGGAYVPLDPRFPRERLQMVLADSGASLLLTGRDLKLDTTAKEIEITAETLTRQSDAVLPGMSGPDALAYVIYTSGSTGTPKGVAIEHGALMNLLRSMERTPGLDADDVLVAVTTISFDIATLELLLPLITGVKLVIARTEQVTNPAELLELMETSGATVLQATPGLWLNLIEHGWTGERPLKVLCGGEAMSRSLAEKLLDRSDDVWNMYGPTETTIWSSANRVTRGTGPMRVGPPIASTQFFVLDGNRQPVPSGVSGELYIGGSGLARGYWNRAELTAEKFIASPFGAGRIYATGDCARWHEDGTVQLEGRADFQVKVRGFRIELGEIEAVLNTHPLVRESVVVQHVTKTETADLARLVAYVAVKVDEQEDAAPALIEELEGLLMRTLPEYMVPNAVHVLEEMPRTPNGKVDRKALPDVFSQAGDSGIAQSANEAQSFVEAEDAVEKQIADIWQTTLGIPRISVKANFFSLGVGSLAALRLIRKMNKVYGTDLGLASLISASSIEAIAELIRNRFSPNTASSLVPIQPVGTRPPLFIVHGVGGNVVNFYGLSMRMGSDQPVYGIQSQALVANAPALLHLTDMATHYVKEIRAVQPHGPYHLLGYSFGGTVVLEMAQQLRAAGEEVAMVGMLDSKSKEYEEQFARSITVHSKVNNRVERFFRNIKDLSLDAKIKYVSDKISTRAIRFSAMAATRANVSHVPSFMKSAYDINYVAVQNYEPQPYDGKLILFRASEQDNRAGARDLGWGSIFRQGVEIHDLPGDHERIFMDPNIDELASSLRASLEACMSRA